MTLNTTTEVAVPASMTSSQLALVLETGWRQGRV
jgi:hypothetical protein